VSRLTRRDWIVLALLFSLACGTAYAYVWAIDIPNATTRLSIQTTIMAGKGDVPLRYRVLAPFIGQTLTGALAPFMGITDAFIAAFAIFDGLAIFASLVALYYYLREWFSSGLSLVGALFAGSMMQVTYNYHWYQPWSLLEPAFFAFGLWLVHRRRYLPFLAVVFVATLNRETGGFLALAYLVVEIGRWIDARRSGEDPPRAPVAAHSAGAFAAWALAYFGMMALLGPGPRNEPFSQVLRDNLIPGNIYLAILNNWLFLGVFWIFAFLGIKKAPRFVVRTAWIAPLYVGALIAFTRWIEVRPLMTLYPILVPLGLSYAFGYDRAADPEAPRTRAVDRGSS
jgi:hypothetical protein